MLNEILPILDAVPGLMGKLTEIAKSDEAGQLLDAFCDLELRAFKRLTDGGISEEHAVILVQHSKVAMATHRQPA